MAAQQLGTIERIVESTRALTSNKTLYGAYKDIKHINQNTLKPTQKSEGIGTDGGVTGNAATTAKGNAKGGASGGSVDVANVTDRGSSGGAQSRTSLEALNRIHSDLGRMNVSVEKISAFTALLARNSMSSLAELSLMNANTTARMNEKEINTQAPLLPPVLEEPTIKGEGKDKDDDKGSLVGTAITGLALRAALPLLLPAIMEVVVPAIAAVAVIGAGVAGVNSIKSKFSESTTPTKEAQIEAKPKRVPLDENSKILPTDDEFNSNEINPEVDIPIVNENEKNVNFGTIAIKQLDVTESNLPNSSGLSGIEDNKDLNFGAVAIKQLQIDQLTLPENIQIPTEEPTSNDINVDEINVPTKEKSLNFGVVAIKSLNIQELILPDDTGLFSDKEDKKSFIDDLEEGLSKGWSKVKDTFSSIGDSIGNAFSGGDQHLPGQHKNEKPIEMPTDKVFGVAGKFESGNDPGKISSGNGDFGGKSYGEFQLSAKTGDLNNFIQSSGYADKFSGITQGSKEFDDKWKELAKTDPKFAQAQKEHAKKTHYDPSVRNLEDKGIDITSKGDAVKASIFSTANQYGAKGGSNKIAAALEGADTSKMSQSDIINKIQDYKESHVNENFKSSSDDVKAGVRNRITNERKLLLAQAQEEESQQQTIQVAKKDEIDDGHGNKVIPYVEPQKTASLEKQQTQSSGNIIADTQAAQSQVTKAPDLSEDNLKRIADQASKPQAPIVVQAPAAPAQQQKATTAPIMAVRDDSPMILNMQYGNLRAS